MRVLGLLVRQLSDFQVVEHLDYASDATVWFQVRLTIRMQRAHFCRQCMWHCFACDRRHSPGIITDTDAETTSCSAAASWSRTWLSWQPELMQQQAGFVKSPLQHRTPPDSSEHCSMPREKMSQFMQ